MDSLKTILTATVKHDISIVDKSNYDQTFIDGLSDFKEEIKLEKNYIVVGRDTTDFPDDLPLNTKRIFKGDTDEQNYVLTVTRTNFTNINYKFKLTDKKNKIIADKSGTAILSAGFVLASEVDEDEGEDGVAYGSSEYWDKANDCWFSIRVGIGKDEKGRQRAKLVYGCEDKNKRTFNVDQCPTLRTK